MTREKNKLIIGSRESLLAVRQTQLVLDYIRSSCPEIDADVLTMKTTGDRILEKRLDEIGGKGLFVKELDLALREGRTDLSVHSLKDMPTELPEGLCLAAITKRFDPGDAVVSPKFKTFDALPCGAKVGTSRLRRKAQLLRQVTPTNDMTYA